MFGGYDPSYNPEALEAKKTENKELAPEQQAMAKKWAVTMGESGVETATAQAVAEAVAETTQAEAEPETEPTIPETEPVLQAQAEENMTQAQIDMANAEASAAAAQAEADQAAMNGEEPEEYEEVEEDYIDQNGKPAKRKVRRQKIKDKASKPGIPVQGMGAEETLQTMAAASPAGAIIAEAVDQALEYAKQGINDVEAPQIGDSGAKEDGADNKDGNEAEPENQGEEEASMTTQAGIQHFPQGEGASSFNPLTPEEQIAQQQAAEANTAQRYDDDNLVAQAVSEGSGKGTIDLNSVGGKLEGQGVGIQGEVDKMKADTAKDVAMAGGDQTEATVDPAQTVDNLTIDTGAEALALKEQAADVKAAVENGDTDADSKVAEFTQAAAETEQLAGIAESASIQAGEQISETVGEARNMAEEAKDAVNQAQTEAAAEEGKKDKDKDKDEDEGENSAFNSDKYPELAGLDNGDRKSIFM